MLFLLSSPTVLISVPSLSGETSAVEVTDNRLVPNANIFQQLFIVVDFSATLNTVKHPFYSLV